MPFDALICDLDMTLIDSRRDIADSVIWSANKLGQREITLDEVLPWIGKGLIKMYQGLFPDVEKGVWNDLVLAYRDHFHDHCNVHTTIYPGVLSTITALRKKGIKTAIATAKMEFMAKRVCQVIGLDEHFDLIQGTDDLPGKPDPAILLAACSKLGVRPKNAVFVGDTIMDVQAGKAAGCFTVAVTYGIGSRGALESQAPDMMADSFSEVAKLF